MADITFSKRKSGDFYYVEYDLENGEPKGESLVGTTNGVTIRHNSLNTTSWIRTKGFTTGTNKVTSITLFLQDAGHLSQYEGSTSGWIKGYFAIDSRLFNEGSASMPNFGHSGQVSFKWVQVNGENTYNGYTTTITGLNLLPGKTYYIYIYCGPGSPSASAWQPLVHPYSGGSSSRTTILDLTFNDPTPYGLVNICTSVDSSTTKGTWNKYIAYVCTAVDSSGKGTWTKAIPYICTAVDSSGKGTWKICC